MLTYRQFLLESKKQFISPYWAFSHAYKEKHRIPELEDFIKTDPNSAVMYAQNVIKGPWPEAENEIARDINASYFYAKDVLKNRFIKGEDILKTYNQVWKDYLTFISKLTYISKIKKWQWLYESLGVITVELLNKFGMDKKMQEYIIQNSPDLIGKIQNLDPELKAKYSHEVELGNIDL
jgi:hypothetical protein